MNQGSARVGGGLLKLSRVRTSLGIGLTLFALSLFPNLTAWRQTPNPGNSSAGGDKQASSQEKPATIKVRVNAVEVRVVVRDDHGDPVPNLKQEDFHLYDEGKLQAITNFAVETPETRTEAALAKAGPPTGDNLTGATEKTVLPDRFVAMLFDDTHLAQGDLMIARKSASGFLDALGPSDRVAFHSTSGQFTHAFSGDTEELKRSLAGLVSHPSLASTAHDCPRVSYYMANRVDTFQDATAFQIIVDDTLRCAFAGDQEMTELAESMAKSAIRQAVSLGQADNSFVYDHVQTVLQQLGAMPGKRTMVFVSPGFSMAADESRMWHLVDQANRAKIVINTLDARGLYTSDVYDAPTGEMPNLQSMKYRSSEQQDQSLILANLAAGTGGIHFGNSNDIAGGLKQLGDTPAMTYILVFSPQNQKADGAFHKLNVELAGKPHYQIQARNGYYVEKKSDNPQEQVKAEIQEALLSPNDTLDLPMELKTQYVKNSPEEARLTVITRLGIKDIHFRKVGDQNCNVLTVVTAIFDDNGNFVLSEQKNLDLKLTTASYEHMLNSGLLMKGEFKVKPGKYMVRQLVRENEDAQMSVRSGAVDIPK